MHLKLNEFSHFVLELNAQALTLDVSDLVSWAVGGLADIIGFDSAWYGWAQLKTTGTIIHASSTLNLPKQYFDAWTEISDQDVLVDQFLADPTCVPTYDRAGIVQTDGMETLADGFGLRKMVTAMCLRPDRTASFFISAYRSGRSARNWTREECEFLQCAVDNISAAARIAAKHELRSPDGQSTSIYFSDHGATIVGLGKLQERFGHLWSRSDGDRIPRWLAEYVDIPGEHVLVDQELVATCHPVPSKDGFTLQKLSVRPLQKFDLLTEREREVARILADGQSHKVAARLLGVAPSTIRNQTQSIYAKMGVDNRASLAGLVPKIHQS